MQSSRTGLRVAHFKALELSSQVLVLALRQPCKPCLTRHVLQKVCSSPCSTLHSLYNSAITVHNFDKAHWSRCDGVGRGGRRAFPLSVAQQPSSHSCMRLVLQRQPLLSLDCSGAMPDVIFSRLVLSTMGEGGGGIFAVAHGHTLRYPTSHCNNSY